MQAIIIQVFVYDLNNLITPVWTLLQLIGEGESPEELRGELVPVAITNIHTMRAYIKEALFFSDPTLVQSTMTPPRSTS